MIRFENGMLALDYPMTKEHAQVIKDFMQYIKEQEQERIIKLLEDKNEELIGHISSWFDYGLDHEAGRANRNKAIELIKGGPK